jgi:hypothetical protein
LSICLGFEQLFTEYDLCQDGINAALRQAAWRLAPKIDASPTARRRRQGQKLSVLVAARAVSGAGKALQPADPHQDGA